MNYLSISDAYLCVDNVKWTDFNFKTIMRYQIWSLYNSNGFGKNENEITDIMSLPWDKENKTHTVASENELKQQKELMRQAEELMKNNAIIEENYIV